MPKRLRFYLEGEAPKSPLQHSTGLRATIFRWLAESDSCLAKLLRNANQVKPLAISPRWSASKPGDASHSEVSVLIDKLLRDVMGGVLDAVDSDESEKDSPA
jgi:hypothetical protein